jgi:hypothetical protein
MAWENGVLVIAGTTAGSEELHEVMRMEASRVPTRFELVVPRRSARAQGAIDAALGLERALRRAAEAGLCVDGRFGDCDPVVAAVENFDPWRIDKIIVCTLPTGLSRWCAVDVPARVRHLTGAPVVQVEAFAPRRGDARAAAMAA